jgi:hypothetical protein
LSKKKKAKKEKIAKKPQNPKKKDEKNENGFDAEKEVDQLKKLVMKIGNSIVWIFAFTGLSLKYFLDQSKIIPSLTLEQRFFITIFLGIITSIGLGILWPIAEKIFNWRFGGGGNVDEEDYVNLPTGFSAIILSATLTIPLLIAPILYELITKKKILLSNHWIAGVAVILGSAVGHLVIYGIKSPGFKGLRRLIMPKLTKNLKTALFFEFICAIVYFTCIALVYQILVSPKLFFNGIFKVYISALVYFMGMSAFITIKYPESINEPTWVQVRGFFAGFLLPVTLCMAMYL